jgi:hypothetical protein
MPEVAEAPDRATPARNVDAYAMPEVADRPQAANLDPPTATPMPDRALPTPGPDAATASDRLVVLARETHISQLRTPAHTQLPPRPQMPAAGPLDSVQRRAASGRLDAAASQPEDGELPPLPTRGTAPESIVAQGSRPARPMPEPANWEPALGGGGGEESGEAGSRSAATTATDSAATNAASETRTAGAAPLPTQQVAGRIVAAALSAQQGRRGLDGAAFDGAMPKAVSAPVVKVLRLQLQPADLGTITIRMSLRDDALDIRLEASRDGTAGLLQRDQEVLAKLLSSAGYRLDGMAVTVSSADATQLADGRATAFQPSAAPEQWGSSPNGFQAGSQAGSQADARSSGGRHNAHANPGPSHEKQHEDNDKIGAGRTAGGGLYV